MDSIIIHPDVVANVNALNQQIQLLTNQRNVILETVLKSTPGFDPVAQWSFDGQKLTRQNAPEATS